MTPEQAYCHCVRNGRNAKLEKIIITDPYWAYIYARDVIEGRWIEAENVIAKDPFYAFFYAKNIMKGKLPENMHNAMILHGIANKNYVTDYLRLINKLKPSV